MLAPRLLVCLTATETLTDCSPGIESDLDGNDMSESLFLWSAVSRSEKRSPATLILTPSTHGESRATTINRSCGWGLCISSSRATQSISDNSRVVAVDAILNGTI